MGFRIQGSEPERFTSLGFGVEEEGLFTGPFRTHLQPQFS